jgi:predicted Rossmann fold flavoprotein
MAKTITIIGGGAAGFFAAIRAAECHPDAEITILERGRDVLQKVKISGGGRCNVTHACFDPRELVKFYPRGQKELRGPFTRFACGDTMGWFEDRGVTLKIEEDGRVFPVSNSSQTIIDCLWQEVHKAGIRVLTHTRVHDFFPNDQNPNSWKIITEEKEITSDMLFVMTGSNPRVWQILEKLGHTIVPPVPSLFTFNIKDDRIRELPGVSLPKVSIHLPELKLRTEGPLLITHWGMSGPAILKLSAWGAREMHDCKYRFRILINWTMQGEEEIKESIENARRDKGKRMVVNENIADIPNRLWQQLVKAAGISTEQRWIEIGKKPINRLIQQLTAAEFQVNGKSTFKEEFVTAGGVDLREVNFKTFESRLFPGLFFAGEVLNIDAVTGGFNFQAAWTGGWIAGGVF